MLNKPDRSKLRVGDRIRLLTVPECDLSQRQREFVANIERAGWTADTIERIIAADPVMTIDRIDEYGAPWFEVELEEPDGTHYHSLTIPNDHAWEFCD